MAKAGAYPPPKKGGKKGGKSGMMKGGRPC